MTNPLMPHDTIVALSSGLHGAAIALVRLSGPAAHTLTAQLCAVNEPEGDGPRIRRASLRQLRDGEELLDEAIVTLYAAPHSYTGEAMAEIACHASPYIVRRVLERLVGLGARYARPGEFTERAFLHGKLDLTQAEAVHDLILSTSRAQHRLATGQMRGQLAEEVQSLRGQLLELASLLELEIDFGEEDVEFANRDELTALCARCAGQIDRLTASYRTGQALRNGVPVAIVGPPNAGKSTLLNHLLQEDRAIVSPIPGTTRDVVEGEREMHGVLFRFADTAGIRETADAIEAEGIERARQRMMGALMVLLVIEAQEVLEGGSVEGIVARYNPPAEARTALVLSKADRLTADERALIGERLQDQPQRPPRILWSGKSKEGAEAIAGVFAEVADAFQSQEATIITNQRHLDALLRARKELEELEEQMALGGSQDLLAFHCRAVIRHLGQITGEMDVEEILGHIFSHFCIGK